jgi:hypothetical protein
VNERRITTEQQKDKDESRLKHIAGLIQKLTFKEMNELSKLINEDVDASDPRLVPFGLLKIADRILEAKVATPFTSSAFR